MTSAQQPPRSVTVAFWSWMAAAVLLIFGGLMAVTAGYSRLLGSFPTASISEDQIRSLTFLFRGVGVLFIIAGLAVGYLAGRTRKGDKRFRRATVVFSYALVLLLILCALLLGIVLPLPCLAGIAAIIAAVAATRDTASTWFDATDAGRDGA
jgi:hypothetical protein